ncbi:MAG: metallophosphoesterase [Anaerolineae bacterium]|nr:metallophosphoesterase [Anaerolineae bacterium]
MLLRVIGLLYTLAWHRTTWLTNGVLFFCALGVVASAGTSAWVNRRYRARPFVLQDLSLSTAFVAFCLFDWALLVALPPLKLSFSPNIAWPLLAAIAVRMAVFWAQTGALVLAQLLKRRQYPRLVALTFLAVNLTFCAVQVDAYVIEPLWVEATPLTALSNKLDPAAPPVRIVHLTDTHIAKNSYRETSVIAKVNALQPDIIVFTGDYLNTTYMRQETSAADFRHLVSQLDAPYGKYAVRGSIEGWSDGSYMRWLFEGTDVTWLEQESLTLDVRGQQVTLVGVACSHDQDTDRVRLERALAGVPDDAFTLLLYHSPDLIEAAAARSIDLYLAGHTHGGQLRLPFYGAMLTFSDYGKQYEAGDYLLENTRLYVSRGLGFEGGGMPQARFLCRPEIVSIELNGK